LEQQADLIKISIEVQEQLINASKQHLQAQSQQSKEYSKPTEDSEDSSTTEKNEDLYQLKIKKLIRAKYNKVLIFTNL